MLLKSFLRIWVFRCHCKEFFTMIFITTSTTSTITVMGIAYRLIALIPDKPEHRLNFMARCLQDAKDYLCEPEHMDGIQMPSFSLLIFVSSKLVDYVHFFNVTCRTALACCPELYAERTFEFRLSSLQNAHLCFIRVRCRTHT